MMDTTKRWIAQFVEIGVLLIAVGVVLEVLFGSNVPFVTGVVGNLTNLIGSLGDGGLIGLIALAIILWLFAKKMPDAAR